MENLYVIIIIIVIVVTIAIGIGIVVVKCCCFRNKSTKKEKRTDQTSILYKSNGQIEFSDNYKSINNSHLGPKNSTLFVENEITKPLRNEPKKKKKHKTSKSFNLNENQDFSKNSSNTLFVEKLGQKITTPDQLFSKHVVNGDITAKRAIALSESRGIDFANEFKRNTVFENPYHFDLCLIQDLSRLGAKSNYVYVASNSVLTYQCRMFLLWKNGKLKIWEKNTLFWKKIIKMENIIFFVKV